MSLETCLRYIASNLKYEIQDMNICREPDMAIRWFIDDYQVY